MDGRDCDIAVIVVAVDVVVGVAGPADKHVLIPKWFRSVSICAWARTMVGNY